MPVKTRKKKRSKALDIKDIPLRAILREMDRRDEKGKALLKKRNNLLARVQRLNVKIERCYGKKPPRVSV